MPTYEYRCKSCGHELEAVQSFSDPALTECPSCGGTLRKVFGSIGVTFKGSGFYKTDSRGSSKSSTSGTGGGSGTSSDSSSTSGDSGGSDSSSSGSSSSDSSSGSGTSTGTTPAP